MKRSFLASILCGAAVLALALAAPAHAEAPFSFDTVPGRLPKTVVPTAYTIHVTPDVQKHTYAGNETVVLTVRKPTKTIEFNTLDMTVAKATVDGVPGVVKVENAAQLTTVTMQHPLTVGSHRLAVSYAGLIQRSAEGLFYQPYRTPDGTTKEMLSTQMESTDARRMFPAWDEPAFRATFQLSVTLPASYAAVSNTPVLRTVVRGDLKTTTFMRTPKMASYLVVLTAGDLESISGEADGVKISIWTTEGKKERGRYALESAEKILAYYDQYFGVKFPLPKLDLIAIPGGFGGAMENWGGITYNEEILLFDPKIGTIGQKQEIFSVEAHEMAHQWFGDLVTMAWWDNLWLNEGFASWMGTKTEDHFNPTWHVWQSAANEKYGAMNSDARLTTHPIQQKITDETQAAAAFDNITYLKGQSFLRMLEQYLGPDTFRAGIRAYISAHKYSNTTTADLWAALSKASGKPVADIARGWTEQPGFPLVSVTATCAADGKRTLALRQSRFLTSGTDPSDEHWEIPVGIRSGTSPASYTLLREATGTAAAGTCDEPLSVNSDNIGYYRVAYDAKTAELNRKNFLRLHADDRIAMLADTWALVQAKKANAEQYLALAASLGDDTNQTEWGLVTGTLGAMAEYEAGKPGEEKFRAYARTILHPVFDKLGWDVKPGDDVPTQELRREIVGTLGEFGDAGVIAEARKRFAAFVANPAMLSPDDLGVVVGIVGRYADQATYDQLRAMAMKAPTVAEKSRYFFAMAAAKDAALAQETLDLSISKDIPPEIASNRIYLVAAVAGAGHAKMAWAFYKANADTLLSSFSTFEKVLGITRAPQIFWNAAPIEELEGYVKKNVPPEAAPYVAKSIDQVKFRQDFQARLVPQVDTAVAAGSGLINGSPK